MANMVCCRLDPESLELLEIEADEASEQNWYDRILRSIHRFMGSIDPHRELPKKTRIPSDAFAAMVPVTLRKANPTPQDLLHDCANPLLNVEEVKQRTERLHLVCNLLLKGTYLMLPRRVRRDWHGNTCIDGTFVKAFGKFTKTNANGREAIEPFARPYIKEDILLGYGWELHTAVAAQNEPGKKPTFPHIVVTVSFEQSQQRTAENTLMCYSTFLSLGYPPGGYAIGDRAYFTSSDPWNSQHPMHLMGFKLAKDYRENQLGIKAWFAGAIQVEGQWYCEKMPKNLITASQDERSGTIDETTYYLRIEARKMWQAKRKSLRDAKGNVRYMHPVDEAGNPYCHDHRGGNFDDAPQFCTQKSVLFPIEADKGKAQELPYKSKEWRAMYSFPRNAVESSNASRKSQRFGLDKSSRRRMRSQAIQFLMSTLVVAASNVKKIIDFRKDEEDPTQAKERRRLQRKPRVFNGYAWTQPPTASPPPELALVQDE